MKKALIALITALLVITPALALKETTIYLPAVRESDFGYEGAMATVTVDIRPGHGHVYVDTWPLTKIDTQASARVARQVACDVLNMECANYDFYYTVRSEAQIVGGPSGGAAMTIATLASLLDLKINNDVLITGTINLDGSIGPISGILEKSEAVSERGHTFLIPYGQAMIEVEETPQQESEPFVISEATIKRINIITYAKKNLNLTVREVRTVQEAFKYFTNYEIKTPELSFERTEEYQSVMKKMADDLIAHAEELKTQCSEELENSNLGYNYETQVSELCQLPLDSANQNYREENYYAASSQAFSRSVSYLYGINLINLLESENQKSFLRDYLKEIEGKTFKVNLSNIELYAITEERVSEAENTLESAWRYYYNDEYIQGMYEASFADGRIYTASLWKKYGEEFPSYIEKTSDLKEASNEVISEVSSILTYISLSSSNSFLEESQELLENAKDSYNSENYYAAIILGLKSEVNAELASETLQVDYDYLIDLHRRKALISINKTKSVIGQSYFEYAETLRNDNKEAALTYYTYAERLSKLNQLLNKEEAAETVTPCEYLAPVSCNIEDYIPVIIVIAIVALFAGVYLGRR